MKAFVVSLANSPRRATIRRRLAATSYDVTLVDAVDARDYANTDDLIGPSAQQEMRRRYGREISKNEVCAVMSHLSALRRVANATNDEPALVLEDDADLQRAPPAREAIAAARADILIAGYTKLEPSALRVFDLQNPFVVRQRFGDWSIVQRYHNQTPGAVAYFVRPAVAEVMTRLVGENGWPTWLADDWSFYGAAGLAILHLHPTLFLEADAGVSYLESGRRHTGLTRLEARANLLPLRWMLAAIRRLSIRWRLLSSRLMAPRRAARPTKDRA